MKQFAPLASPTESPESFSHSGFPGSFLVSSAWLPQPLGVCFHSLPAAHHHTHLLHCSRCSQSSTQARKEKRAASWRNPAAPEPHLALPDSPLVLVNQLADLSVLFFYTGAFFKQFLLQTFIFLPMTEIRSVWFPSNSPAMKSAQLCVLGHLYHPLDVVQDDGGFHGHTGHAHRQASLLLQVVYLPKSSRRESVISQSAITSGAGNASAYLGGQLIHLIHHFSYGQTDLSVLLSGFSHQEVRHISGAWRKQPITTATGVNLCPAGSASCHQ